MDRRPLARLLLAWALPPMCAAVVLTAATGYVATRAVVLEQLQRRARDHAAIAAAGAQRVWDEAREEIETVARSPIFDDYFANVDFGLAPEAETYRREIERMLLDAAAPAGSYARLRFLDASGRELAVVENDRVRPPSSRKDAAAARIAAGLAKGGAYPQWKVAGGERPAGVWRAPVLDSRRRTRGFVEGEVPFETLHASLKGLTFGETGRAWLTARAEAGPRETAGGRVVVAAPVLGTPLEVALSVERGEFTRPLTWVILWIVVVVLATIVGLALALPRRLEQLLAPVRRLSELSRQLAEGDLAASAPEEGPLEAAQLARAFNAMVASVRRLLRETASSEARYRSAVENSPYAVLGLDQHGAITLWNRRAEALFGFQPTEAFGRTPAFLFHPDEYARLERLVDTEGAARDVEVRGRGRDGRPLLLNVSWSGQASPGGAREWFVVIQDVTERKRLESQLLRAEKLSVVGTLLAGIAHELNNPLAAVTGLSELLQESGVGPQEAEDLRQLRASALRCRDIVQGLLAFARPGEAPRRRVALNEVARASLGLLEYRLVRADRVSVELDLDPAQPAAAADFSRLQQVVVNLLANAGDALRCVHGRRVIRLTTRSRPDAVVLTVEDNGPGVPAAMRESVFEAFMTTKPAGTGTGLGLSVSAEIARQAGGTLACDEAAGGGARFVLTLPPCPAEVPATETAGRLPPPAPGRRVLVVDDEPEVARTMARLLESDRLSVSVARGSDEGRAALRARPRDLVVCDVDLGSADGFALYDGLEPVSRPPFLFVTGDTLNPDLRREAARRGAVLLDKPFLQTELIASVRAALSAARR